jgi:hypothetical protein
MNPYFTKTLQCLFNALTTAAAFFGIFDPTTFAELDVGIYPPAANKG